MLKWLVWTTWRRVRISTLETKCFGIIISCACVFSVCVQVSAEGHQSIPLNLAVSWRCEPTSTDLRIDYKYNGEAMTTPMALNNVQFLVPVDGGVSKLQAVLPPAAWYCLNLHCYSVKWKFCQYSTSSAVVAVIVCVSQNMLLFWHQRCHLTCTVT